MALLTATEDIKRVLVESHSIAVLGAHKTESKPAYYVPHYLKTEGYEIYPVNPTFAGELLHDRKVVAKLNELDAAINVVEVFRRSEHLPGHVSDILAMDPLPKVVWFQLGIQNDEAAQKLSEAGIDVVQNHCMLAEHQRLLGKK